MTNLEQARIIRVNRGQYIVNLKDREYTALLAGKLQHQDIYPVIGDYVGVVVMNDREVLINEVMERSSYLSRPNQSGHADGFVKTVVEQAMVANLDYLFIVTSMNDDFSVNRIMRFAATSVKGGCKPVIVLSKADLCDNREEFVNQVREINRSIDVFCVSSYTGEGIDSLRQYVKPGLTIGFMGSSGVGKSTLINTLAGSEIMKVSEIRDKDSKGRHTTTHRELININGTYFVDTPGMREFGLCDVEEGLNETFEDIANLMGCCKFSDCSHSNEPGCAINAALSDGTLTQERWELYQSLMAESNRSSAKSLKKKIALQKKQIASKEKHKGKLYY